MVIVSLTIGLDRYTVSISIERGDNKMNTATRIHRQGQQTIVAPAGEVALEIRKYQSNPDFNRKFGKWEYVGDSKEGKGVLYGNGKLWVKEESLAGTWGEVREINKQDVESWRNTKLAAEAQGKVRAVRTKAIDTSMPYYEPVVAPAGEVAEPKYMTTEPAHSALRTTQYPEPDTLQARNTFIKEKAATRQDIKRYNLPPGAIALFGSDPVPVGYVQVYASQLISKSIKNKGKVLGGMYYFAPKLVAEGVPKKLEGEAWYTHSWNADKLGTRVQLVLEAKWVNNKGQLTKLGEKIAQSKWGDLTPAAQNVLRRGLDKLYGRPVALPTAETGG